MTKIKAVKIFLIMVDVGGFFSKESLEDFDFELEVFQTQILDKPVTYKSTLSSVESKQE